MTSTIVGDTLTVVGAAGIVATFVQLTKFIIDAAVKDQSTNASVTRLYVFMVAIALCALPPLQAHGFNLRGDVLSLLTLAFAVAGTAISEYHLLSLAPITSKPTVPFISGSIPIGTETLGLPTPGAPVQETPAA